MGLLRLAIAVAALALLLPAATSSAAGSSDASERSAAKAFADAAAVLAADVRSTAPAVRINREALKADCFLPQLRRAREAGTPSATLSVVGNQGTAILHELVYEPTVPALERFVARLDRVRTSDPVSRAGRTAWRGHLAAFRVYAGLNVPLDLCVQMTAWADSAGRAPFLPGVDFTAAARELQSGAVAAREQRMQRAAQRLRVRGQARQRAGRFAFANAFSEHIEIHASLLAPYEFVG